MADITVQGAASATTYPGRALESISRGIHYLATSYEKISWNNVGCNIMEGAKKVAKEALPIIVKFAGKLTANVLEYGPIGAIAYQGMQAIAHSYSYIFHGCWYYFDPMMDLKAYYAVMSKGVFFATLAFVLIPVLKPLAQAIRDSSQDLANHLADKYQSSFYNSYFREAQETIPVVEGCVVEAQAQ